MKIKASFNIPTPDLKGSIYKQLPVTVNLNETDEVHQDPEYTVTLPDIIFKELADTEDQFKTVYDHNVRGYSGMFSRRTVTRKFQRTQTSTSLEMLRSYVNGLTKIINEKYSIETETKKKKIFIYFNHTQNHITNGLNGAYWGEKITQGFHYFTGYEIMTDKYNGLTLEKVIKKQYISHIFYASVGATLRSRDTGFKEGKETLPLPNHNMTTKDMDEMFSIIDWTEERELFCESIKNTFIDVNVKLAIFLKDLDNTKFDHILEQKTLFKLLK